MKKGLALFLVLAVAASAQAAWVGTGPESVLVDGRLEVEVLFMGTNPNPLCGPVDMYQVNLNALAPADAVIGVDVAFVACETSMYQLGWWQFPPGTLTTTPDMYMAQWLADPTMDSHFLLNANYNPGPPPSGDWSDGNAIATENNDRTCGVNLAGESEGWGTFLGVVAFVSAPARAQDLAFAWITVPEGAPMGAVRLTGSVSNGVGEIFDFGVDCTDGIPIPIPEPATMGLLVLGGLGLIARKRR